MVIIIFFLGLIIGSFLNVVIYRLDKNQSIWFGRSACPHCRKKIFWYDNIPVLSFILLGGQCRHCQKKISLQYPLVEIATALLLVLLFWRYGLSEQFIVYAIFSAVLIVIFAYDLKTFQILDQITIPTMIFAFLVNLYLGMVWWQLILAAMIGALFFAAQFFVSSGKWVGDGDIRLGALMGAMLGWPNILVALFLAYLIGAGVGIILLSLKRKEFGSAIPFGPFLTLATFITLICGKEIMQWYLNLIYY